MSNRRRLFSIRRWWNRRRAPRKIAAPREAGSWRRWLTLRPLRMWMVRTATRFFAFDQPVWSKTRSLVKYAPDKQLRWFDYFNPFYHFRWGIGFTYRWLVSRPYRNLGPALVAIAAGMLMAGTLVRERLEKRDWREEQYRRLLTVASAAKDYETASLCLTRLSHRYPDRETYRFQQALIDSELGNEQAAAQKMYRLASQNRNTEAALFLLVKQFDLQNMLEWTTEQHDQFRALSEIALSSNDAASRRSTRIQLAKYFYARGARAEAAANFAAVAGNDPALLLTTATLYRELGDETRAQEYAEQAQKLLEAQLLATPSDKEARMALAQVLIILKKEEAATRLLSDGLKITGDQDFARAGSEALVAWAIRVRNTEGDTKASLAKQMNYLQLALRLTPTSQPALEFLLELAIRMSDTTDEDILRMQAEILDTVSPESFHFVQGTVALLKNDLKKADFHLNLAAEQNQQLPGILNNLAVALSKQEGADLQRALALSEAANERVPNHPYIRETRGQILVKLGRFREAIPDLEFALQAPELAPDIHASLASAYEALGQDELAAEQRRLATPTEQPQ